MKHTAKCLAAILGIATLSACDSMEKGFSDGWEKSFEEQCVSTATNAGAPKAQVAAICSCSAKKLGAELTTSEKVNPPQEKLIAAAQTCTTEALGDMAAPSAATK